MSTMVATCQAAGEIPEHSARSWCECIPLSLNVFPQVLLRRGVLDSKLENTSS